MVEVLYAPDKERVVTTNAWAFLHWLRTTRGVDRPDWAALQRWSVDDPAGFSSAIAAFAPLRPQGRSGDLGHALAECLLHADLRPDDRLLVCGSSGPWTAAGTESFVAMAAGDPLATAATERASVLVVPAQTLAEATFQRPRQRADLSALRTIIATGGPMSPGARRRIYTWVKADIMLLARTGDTFWGNPLEPVLAQPPATPAFVTPPPSVPAPR
jgi:hypothetical protein